MDSTHHCLSYTGADVSSVRVGVELLGMELRWGCMGVELGPDPFLEQGRFWTLFVFELTYITDRFRVKSISLCLLAIDCNVHTDRYSHTDK